MERTPSSDTIVDTTPTATALAETAMVSARYKVTGPLGAGGMGEVLSAYDAQIGRSVAIKRLRGVPSEDSASRFVREAKIQGRLDHPAIVPVHELSHDADGNPYFVMKQLAGTTLAAILVPTDRAVKLKLTQQQLLSALANVCLAIEFAHARGVIHRDLKPSNIMLGDFGEVWVLDWGIARVLDADDRLSSGADELPEAGTAAGTLLGTPGYMSPEQIRGDVDLDGRADVYALGCILFEVLTNSPLHTPGIAGIAESLAGHEIRPSERVPQREIPPELDALCVEATMSDRTARIATARELGERIQRYLEGDRDLALRQELARAELDIATTAFERAGSLEDRRDAMRAAGRALALDPQARGPAELVGRMMLEPTREVPPEVERILESNDRDVQRKQAKAGMFAMLAYFVFFPFFFWAGVAEPWFAASVPCFVITVVAGMLAYMREPRRSIGIMTFVLNCALMILFARAFSPFLIAPFAVIISMAYVMHPRFGSPYVIAASLIAAVLVPLGLELVGVLSSTASVVGASIVIHPAADTLNAMPVFIMLAMFVVLVVVVGGALARSLTTSLAAAQRRLEMQSWLLRQLVPHRATG